MVTLLHWREEDAKGDWARERDEARKARHCNSWRIRGVNKLNLRRPLRQFTNFATEGADTEMETAI